MLNIALIDAANIITLNFPRRRKDRRDRDLLYTIGNSLNLPDFVYKFKPVPRLKNLVIYLKSCNHRLFPNLWE